MSQKDVTPTEKNKIFTIGHSSQPLDHFLTLLKAHKIDVLVDIRSHPISKFAPHFDKQPLKIATKEVGIKYLFLGKELGGKPQEPELYDSKGHALYEKIAKSDIFIEGISRLEEGIKNYRVAIMCSEENPVNCHRRILVGRVLEKRGINIVHIRTTGELQTESEFKKKLEQESGAIQPPLFPTEELTPWKSIQSVLPKKPHNNSSKH